jgi:hypothetical protein
MARDNHYATPFVPIFGWTRQAARIGLHRSKSSPAGRD